MRDAGSGYCAMYCPFHSLRRLRMCGRVLYPAVLLRHDKLLVAYLRHRRYFLSVSLGVTPAMLRNSDKCRYPGGSIDALECKLRARRGQLFTECKQAHSQGAQFIGDTVC